MTDPPSFESKPIDVPEDSATEQEQLLTRRVHILGAGSIGTLIAHSLRCMPNPPPISLLMHREEMYEDFKKNHRSIRLQNKITDIEDEQTGYDVDLLENKAETELPYWHSIYDRQAAKENGRTEDPRTESGEVYIYTIIVSVKGPATIRALTSIKHRLNQHSTICLMQNGMGQIDELNKKVFTDPATRPIYMLGILSHGAYLTTRFHVVHAGFGTAALGIYRDNDRYPPPPKSASLDLQTLSQEDRKRYYPSDEDLYSNLSTRYLLRTLTRCPALACAPFPYLDLFQLQLEKLAMNSVLNPLTALLDIHNGSILSNNHLTHVQRLLLAEISLVLRSLPELEGIPGVERRFSASRLESLVVAIAKTTARNSSSMREDVRNLRETEIKYINGYVVRRGEELGLKCVLNYMLMQLVEAKSLLTARTAEAVKPYGSSELVGRADGDVTEEGAATVTLQDEGTKYRAKNY